MNNQSVYALASKLTGLIYESSQRTSLAHAQFLQQREVALKNIERLIGLSLNNRTVSDQVKTGVPIFDKNQLEEFGTGRISRCFGPTYARYDSRRIPRIPNGDLLMMSRVIDIHGNPGDTHSPADVVVEYDVPENAWYFSGESSFELPYSLLMETALQPCGFLSAYLDTYGLVPHEHFFFRNLDGFAQVINSVDARGKTLTTRARLIKNIISGGTVIQKFGFSVGIGDIEMYRGESTFGYFASETMTNQVGLDGGKLSEPWKKVYSTNNEEIVDLQLWRAKGIEQNLHLPAGRMGFLNQVSIYSDGGKYGKGYLYAARTISPTDWFFPYHFFGDPVMPGSLGVEAVLEALKAYALAQGLGITWRLSEFSLPIGGAPLTWRYRGQITPQHSKLELDVHVHSLECQGSVCILVGDANVWIDGLRIYEVKNATVRIHEGNHIR